MHPFTHNTGSYIIISNSTCRVITCWRTLIPLLWGGLYFREDKFYEKAIWLLAKELNEQILPDGAHYELSPMYHTILSDRLLDCINALKHNPRFEGQEFVLSFLIEKHNSW